MKKTAVFTLKNATIKIALASAAVVIAAPVSASSLKIYGTADAWVGSSRPIDGESQGTVRSGGMQTSYFGLGGSEDLGNNLKAVFALEGYMRLNTGSQGRFEGDSLFSRSAYVGLEGNFGRLVVGRTTTPYFISTVVTNPLGGSFTFSPGIFHTYAGNGPVGSALIGDSGWSNSVLYTTPNMGGLSANFQYARGSANVASGNPDEESGAQKMGGNVMYMSGPLTATVAVQRVNFNSNAGDLSIRNIDNQLAVLAGAAYDFNVVKVYGSYQHIKNDAISGRDTKLNGGQVGVRVPTGQVGAILASYAHTKTTGAIRERRNTWAVAYQHPLSKRTELYGAYFRDSVTDRGHGNNVGVGIKHTF